MNVLICPLDWGLGHATRCVPIINRYISEGHSVTIASSGYALQFLKLRYPALQIIEISSHSIRYAAVNTQVFSMIRNMFYIVKATYNDRKWLKNYLKTTPCDLIISDNRFGLFSDKTKCVYITHQIMVKMPAFLRLFEVSVYKLHLKQINKYTECWIPDIEGEPNYSGDLAHKYPLPANAKYIGLLSRFSGSKVDPVSCYDVVVIISGPEPHRTLFENQIIKKYQNRTEQILVFSGKPGEQNQLKKHSNITIAPHATDKEFAAFCVGAKKIIARSGYSSIMDLIALNCIAKVEFIPTPGQTEQEYLAAYFATSI